MIVHMGKTTLNLKDELIKEGVGGMTVSDVRGFGRETTRPSNYLILPKLKVEIYCTDDQVATFVDTIIRICRQNQLGDGKIAVLDVEDLIRVRTGERQQEAVY